MSPEKKLVRGASKDAHEEASDFWEALKAARLVCTLGVSIPKSAQGKATDHQK